MPAAADDDVVVDGNAERFGGVDDLLGDRDIGLGRRRVTRRVIVHQDQRRGAKLQRPFDHLAGIDRRVIDRAALLLLVGDQRILAVEEEEVKFPAL
jgi:hypothetical protein